MLGRAQNPSQLKLRYFFEKRHKNTVNHFSSKSRYRPTYRSLSGIGKGQILSTSNHGIEKNQNFDRKELCGIWADFTRWKKKNTKKLRDLSRKMVLNPSIFLFFLQFLYIFDNPREWHSRGNALVLAL